MIALAAKSITKIFHSGDELIKVLDDVNLEVESGKIVGIIGSSGCGKSTLLQIIGLIDSPDSGTVEIDGVKCNAKDRNSNYILATKIGFIYQSHHLFPEFSALENVLIPQAISGLDKTKAMDNAIDLLHTLGLKNKLHSKPHMLSGGERQRVAIARALSKRPSIVLADEPTGNLDPHNAAIVLEEMISVARDFGSAVVYVTHNHSISNRFDATYTIKEGKIVIA